MKYALSCVDCLGIILSGKRIHKNCLNGICSAWWWPIVRPKHVALMKYALSCVDCLGIILSGNTTACSAFKTYHAVRSHLFINRSFCLSYNLWRSRWYTVGRDSSVGIANRYGLHLPGIEFRWGWRFSSHVQTGSGAHPAPCTVGTGSLSPGQSGRDVASSTRPYLAPRLMNV